MKYHPLMFTGESVRGVLGDPPRKTMTRRVLSPQPGTPQHKCLPVDHFSPVGKSNETGRLIWEAKDHFDRASLVFPHGISGVKAEISTFAPGDRIWGKEAWFNRCDHEQPCEGLDEDAHVMEYRADSKDRWPAGWDHADDEDRISAGIRWGSPMFMPRWASRITLDITGVRIERVQDISEEDALAEGIIKLSKDQGRTWKFGIADSDGLPGTDDHGWPWQKWELTAKEAFYRLWDSIHGINSKKPENRVATNPWVIAITFKRVEGGE